MRRTIHVVSHSHWDREWHQTFQQFRLRLVRLIDDVLDVLATNAAFSSFMLDGQTIVLDDYLEIRPEREAELRLQIQAGRLLIGPWYNHPDEFLVSGEAIVRNLLLGRRMCATWGGRMNVGYVPDQFGHIAQLPQLFHGFGIDNAVLWRGVDHHETGLACHWKALDGSAILLASLPYGYNNADRLPVGGQAMAERVRALASLLENFATEGQPLLLMNGGDHTDVQADLPTGLKRAQDLLSPNYTASVSTLPAYLEELRAASLTMPEFTGELRNPRRANLLPAVLSSRIWIKQRNSTLQTLLERQTEPLAVLAAALGKYYPAGEIRQSWRYLLQNHPHDSICGCSIDQVHREMVTRFDWAEQIAIAVRDTAFAVVGAHISSMLPGAEDPRALAVTVFNGAPAPQSGRFDVHLHLVGEAHTYELVDALGNAVPHYWLGESGEGPTTLEVPKDEAPDMETIMSQVEGNRVIGMGISAVTMRTIGGSLQVEVTVGDQALLSREEIAQSVQDALDLLKTDACTKVIATIHRSADLHLVALAPETPSCGYTTLLLRPRAKSAPSRTTAALLAALPVIENERYRVEADPGSGALTITHITSGITAFPVNVFLDGGDAGDLYTYSPPPSDLLVSSMGAAPEIEREIGPLGESLRLRWTLDVPIAMAESLFERADGRTALRITSTVTLAPGDPIVRFKTQVENTAFDHRLRAHVTLPFHADHVHAEDAFGLVERPAQPDRSGDWAEEPDGAGPHQGVLALHGIEGSCLLIAPGLPEYEALPQTNGTTDVALTLLRCTGWLSRNVLPNRPAEAGPNLPTPDAQSLGSHTFEYAIVFGPEPWRELLPAARTVAVSLVATVGQIAEGHLPHTASFVHLTPSCMILSALKGAEDGRGVILRLYNDGQVPEEATIHLLLPVKEATLVNLAEEDEGVVFSDGPKRECRLNVPGGGIRTLRLLWDGPTETR